MNRLELQFVPKSQAIANTVDKLLSFEPHSVRNYAWRQDLGVFVFPTTNEEIVELELELERLFAGHGIDGLYEVA